MPRTGLRHRAPARDRLDTMAAARHRAAAAGSRAAGRPGARTGAGDPPRSLLWTPSYQATAEMTSSSILRPNAMSAARVFDRPLLRARHRRAAALGATTFLVDRVADDLADRLAAVQRSFAIAVD